MITHTEHARVQFIDTDASGRIQYTAAFRHFEAAEHALARRLFDGKLPQDLEIGGFPRVHVEADLKALLTENDAIECTARVVAVGRTSVTYSFETTRADGRMCLTGRIVAVAVGAAGRPMPLPETLRRGFESAL